MTRFMTAEERKAHPVTRGVLDYFPDALLEVAHCSKVGNDQHNPGQPMHWAKEKSTDEADALVRHLMDRGKFDSDGVRHSAKVAWRALALLQREIEAERSQLTQTASERLVPRYDEPPMPLFHEEYSADNGELPKAHYEGEFATLEPNLQGYPELYK